MADLTAPATPAKIENTRGTRGGSVLSFLRRPFWEGLELKYH